MRKCKPALVRGTLEQLARRRLLERQDGAASGILDAELSAALDALDWLSVIESQPWMTLSAEVSVANELVEAHRLASCLAPLLGGEHLLFVDCGCAHGLTSLLLYHLLPAPCKPSALQWIDKDSACRASKLAPAITQPSVVFVQADFLQPDFCWPSQPFVLICNKVTEF
jgi:hypothetical protein